INSINLYNENRKILRQIHELRILDTPKLNGTNALRLFMANNSIPKERANQELMYQKILYLTFLFFKVPFLKSFLVTFKKPESF
ncbi:MAG: hypothetical protein ACTSYC_00910, partial [Promethearchaeota archaeon]